MNNDWPVERYEALVAELDAFRKDVRARGWTNGLLIKAIADVESSVKYDAKYLYDNGVPFLPRKAKAADDKAVARENANLARERKLAGWEKA